MNDGENSPEEALTASSSGVETPSGAEAPTAAGYSPKPDTSQEPPPDGSLDPRPEYNQTLNKFRSDELLALRRKLARMPERPKFRNWSAGAGVLFGAGVGGLIAGLPLLASKSKWDPWIVPVYAVVVVGVLVIALLCARAAAGMIEERSVTLQEMREDLDRVLEVYGIAIPEDEIKAGRHQRQNRVARAWAALRGQ